MPDPEPGNELVKIVATGASPMLARIADTVFGSMWARYLSRRSPTSTIEDFERQLHGLQRACELIEESGLPFNPLSAKACFPLMDALEVEEDPDLQERWANLLANGATSSDLPLNVFAEVLRQIDARDAGILIEVFTTERRIAPQLREKIGVSGPSVCRTLKISQDDFRFHVDNLVRLRLIIGISLDIEDRDDQYGILRVTTFGERFIRACRAPGESDPVCDVDTREKLDELLKAGQELVKEPKTGSTVDGDTAAVVDALTSRLDDLEFEHEQLQSDVQHDARGA